jgi:ankyrin repeat protein
MEDSGGRGHKSKRRGHRRSETENVSKKHKKKKAKIKHRKRKRDEQQQPAHARTATKREKLTKRLFAAISRCGSGRAAGGDTATDAAVALHDVRYYTARLLRLAASSPSSSADAALAVVVDDTGRTPLHRAVMQDNAALCRYLIDALGRDVVNMVAGSEVP